MDNIKIGNHFIGHKGSKVFIIAEAGVNHNGSLKLAKKIIDMAKFSGADAVKFQTFKTELLVVKNSPKATYQNRSVPDKTQFEMLKDLELTERNFKELFDYSKQRKIVFLSTAFDHSSASFLHKLGVCAYKVSSGDITDFDLLSHIAGYGKPVILSTGMSTLKEVNDAVLVLRKTGNKRIILMHCTSDYPAKFGDVNLKAMVTLKDFFKLPVGYSDHTEGIEIAIASVVFGASVIEKHFTIDKKLPGPDHKASLDVFEFSRLVKCVRNVEQALGNGIKSPSEAELNTRRIVRKSVVSMIDIPKGAFITSSMLTVKRPGFGIRPGLLYRIIGKRAKKFIARDKVLTPELFV